MKCWLTIWGLLWSVAGLFAPIASAHQDPEPVRTAIETYLRQQVKGLPGKVSYTIGGIAQNNRLMPCTAFQVGLPAGAKSWGRTTVSVHCQSKRGWTIFVPVHIHVVTDYLVTALPLARGQTISASDLTRRRGDLSDLPAGVLTDEKEAVGRTASFSILAGLPLRADMLRQPVVVLQNQTVKVISGGPGFRVANEGRALSNGLEGQIVRVRLSDGQIVSGIARRGGIVEIGF
jgi:flagella basal body P-ring formation protein FlgA